jgi:N-acetyltransferase
MKVEAVTLTGNHIRIVPMEAEHIPGLFEAGNQPQIWTYLPMRVSSYDDMERLVSEALAAKDSGLTFPFVIQDVNTHQIVGSTRFLDISSEHRNLEIGWTWLSPLVWRSPVNTECKYLLLKHAFETLGTSRVQIKTDRRNVRSQNAIERIGGVREGVLRQHRIMYDGYIRDTVYYSILDTEWLGVRKKLEEKLER